MATPSIAELCREVIERFDETCHQYPAELAMSPATARTLELEADPYLRNVGAQWKNTNPAIFAYMGVRIHQHDDISDNGVLALPRRCAT